MTTFRVTDLIRRHPLISFLLVFNTFGQAVAFVPVIARAKFGIDLDVDLFLVIPTLFLLLLPALVITRIASGPTAVHDLLRRAVRFGVHPFWYLLALIGFPVIALVFTFAAPSDGWSTAHLASAYVTGFIPVLLFNFFTTNLWEETVWMGFFQAPLQQRFGPMRAVLITAPFFALEHISLVFSGSTVGGGAPEFVILLVAMVFVRSFLAWVYNRTGSLAMVGLLHAASNAIGYGLITRLYANPGAAGVYLLVLGLVVIVATRGRLGLPRHLGTAPVEDRPAPDRQAAAG